jgi:concentrative nucleoside transporter, CNT family
MDILRGLIGITFLCAVALLLSSNRKQIRWSTIGVGILLQIIFGLAIFKVGFVHDGFSWMSEKFVAFLDFARHWPKTAPKIPRPDIAWASSSPSRHCPP